MINAATKPSQQRARALKHANAIRLARAELKRRIAEGEVTAAQIILECPDEAERWTVSELLMCQRRWGCARCRKFLEQNKISEIKQIGGLTERQRRLLAFQLCAGSQPKANVTPLAPRERPLVEQERSSVVEREPRYSYA